MIRKIKVNNKGFTLIELLAVIVILGILMIIALPAITKYITSSKKDAFVDIAKTYINSVRYAYLNDDLDCSAYIGDTLSQPKYVVTLEEANKLLEKPGISPWTSTDIKGVVAIETDANGRTIYKFAGSDGTHGTSTDLVEERNLKRSKISLEATGTHAYWSKKDTTKINGYEICNLKEE